MIKLIAPNPLNNLPLFSLFCAVLVLVSCRSNRETANDHHRIPNLKTSEIVDSMNQKQLDCDWLSIKYDVKIKTAKIDDSFKSYVRMKKDSAIWISATYYAVEVGRFLLTPDTVKYMDRRKNQYYIGGYEYLNDLLLFETSFDLIQNIILGNSNALIELDEKVKSSKDKGGYMLSFLRKGQLKRAKKKEELNKDVEVIVSLWVDPKTFRVNQTSLQDFKENRSLEVEYSAQQATCNSHYPYQMEVLAKSENEQAEVKTSVMKLTTGKEVSLSFTIPEKYEPLVP